MPAEISWSCIETRCSGEPEKASACTDTCEELQPNDGWGRGAHGLVVAGTKGYAEELDEFVFHILDKIQVRSPRSLHNKHRQVRVWLLDAC